MFCFALLCVVLFRFGLVEFVYLLLFLTTLLLSVCQLQLSRRVSSMMILGDGFVSIRFSPLMLQQTMSTGQTFLFFIKVHSLFCLD